MENSWAEKKQAPATPMFARAMWDPFWFMREMFGLGHSTGAPSFDVNETDDTYVCKVNVKLTLPGQADVAHLKAELDDGELTLVVPKVAAAVPAPELQVEPEPEAASPPAKAPRTTGSGRKSPRLTQPRRGARSASRRG